MIIKEFGNETEEQITQLKELSKNSNKKYIKNINIDLKKLKNGYQSEKDNAYYIDFEFRDSKNIIVLHDIRIEHNGRTAQIDHILISRIEVTVLESKSFDEELTIKDDGSLFVKYKNNDKTFPNPIEQNNRHLKVLKALINDKFELQANTKLFGGISFSSKILINPNTTISNKKLPEGFERADSYITKRKQEIDNIKGLKVLKLASKMMSINKVEELANFLIKHHKPFIFDYTKKYPIEPITTSYVKEPSIIYNKPKIQSIEYTCTKCKSKNLEVAYGRNYYFKCLDCENNIPIKHTCNTPNCKPKTRKSKLQFFKVCEKCGIDELFWENKS